MFNAPFQVRYVTLFTSDNFPFNNDTIPASALFVDAAPRFGSRSAAPGRHNKLSRWCILSTLRASIVLAHCLSALWRRSLYWACAETVTMVNNPWTKLGQV